MRSFLLTLTTVVLLSGAFYAYTRLVEPPPRPPESSTTVPLPSATAPIAVAGPLGAGAGAWVNLYDRNTGDFYARLRAQVYTPRPDGLCHLTKPEAEFYQRDGQIVHMMADDGDVTLDEQTQRGTISGGPVNPPSQGTLHNVVMLVFPGQSTYESNQPDLTIHLDNAQFDADTYRLFTIRETDRATGKTTAADEVPVTMRGRDMDFDGRGLMLYWNDATHELKSLLVAHGDRLRLKSQGPAQPVAKANSNPPTAPAKPSVPAPVVQAADQEPAMAPPSPVHTYLATFSDNVRVVQDGQNRILADQMDVTLARHNDEPSDAGATPTPSPEPRPAAPKPATLSPPPVKTAANPTQPVDVYWTGTLNVVPAENPDETIPPGQAVVRFGGSPVHVFEQGMEMIGDRARYVTATGIAHLIGNCRLTLLKKDGSPAGTVVSERVDYYQNQQLAVFGGVGVANLPDAAKPNEAMIATWNKSCGITLASNDQQTQIRHARLQGDALIVDGPRNAQPRLRLAGQQIDADFDQTSTVDKAAPSIRRIVATDQANCRVRDEKGAEKFITSDKLTIDTAKDSAGQIYPKFVTGEGSVHAQQDQDELWSDRLFATVAPQSASDSTVSSEDGKYALQTLLATGNVRARNKDGNTAAGDALSIEEHDQRPLVTLAGNPMATVTGNDGVLRGREIQVKPKEQWALATGQGSIDCIRASAAGQPAKPMHVRWDRSAELLGDKNLIDVRGHVWADTTEANGTANTAGCEHALLYLVAAPTTKPSQASAGHDVKFDLLQGKQVRKVTLLDDAQITSVLKDDHGAILRRSYINGQQIDSYLAEQRLVVPGPGRMLLENHGKEAPAAASADPSSAGGHGVTGFWWDKQFNYDEAAHQAVIDGSVVIRHRPDTPHAALTQVWADRAVADFDATKPSTDPSDEGPKLKQVRATGHVHILTDTAIIDAAEVDYDPATFILTASAPENDRVDVTDRENRGEVTFQQVWIDTRTNQIINSVDFQGEKR